VGRDEDFAMPPIACRPAFAGSALAGIAMLCSVAGALPVGPAFAGSTDAGDAAVPGPLRAFKIDNPPTTTTIPAAQPTPQATDKKGKAGKKIAATASAVEKDPLKRRFRGVFRAAIPDGGSGTVTVQPTSTARELKLEDFQVSEVPDLEILLVAGDRIAKPDDVLTSKRVSLGRLKKIVGRQIYRMPAEVDPSTYRSVVIWSKRRKIVVASARLEPTT
jgi:hypothetical protein